MPEVVPDNHQQANPDRVAVAMITYVQVVGEVILLLSVCDKSERENLDEGELNDLLNEHDLP